MPKPLNSPPSVPPGERPLTPKQEAFVLEYLKDLNATQAAIRAGYSRRTAKQQGQRLLTNVDLSTRLSEALAAPQVEARVESERLEREAERISISDIRRVFRDGCLLAPEEIPDDIAPAIASIEVVTKEAGKGKVLYVNKIRFWDKNTAQKTLFQLRGDGKVNEQNLNMKGSVAVHPVIRESELAIKHKTPEQFERACELSGQINELGVQLKVIIDAALSKGKPAHG